MFEPCEQMLLSANAGGSVAVTASIVVCVPPVSGGVDEFDVGGLFPSMGLFPQLVRASVAAAKTIRYRARVIFSVSAGTGQGDIFVLFLMCRNDLRSHLLVLAVVRCDRKTVVVAPVGGDCCDCEVTAHADPWHRRHAGLTFRPCSDSSATAMLGN